MQSKKKARTKYKRLAFVAVVVIVVAILLILNKSTNLFSSIGLNNLTDAVDYDTTVGENAIVSSATLQLYNEDQAKGLKGIEYSMD